MCGPVSKVEHECACPSAPGDSVMIPPHALVCIKSGACICACFSLFESLQVSGHIKCSACTSTSWKVDSAVVEGVCNFMCLHMSKH